MLILTNKHYSSISWIGALRFVFVLCALRFILISLIISQTQTYPRLAGYTGIVHPIISFSKSGTTTNFKDYYIGGLPVLSRNSNSCKIWKCLASICRRKFSIWSGILIFQISVNKL